MKRVLFFCVLLLTFVGTVTTSVVADELLDITRAAGYDVKDYNRPKSSIIIDAKTGDVLWQDNVDEVRDPASMSKLMTLYLVFEAIKEGKLSEDTVITATANDQAISKIYEISNNKIVAGVDYKVSELITMTAVPSSNATTVMLANYLSNNNPDTFLDMMNAKAQELGMTNTKWFNASGAAAVSFKGLYNPQNYNIYSDNQTTARDLAILGYNFVNRYPDILKYTSKPVVTVKAGTPYEETFETYNYSLPGAKYGLNGVDGLKTGSSPNGAFNYIATMQRGEQRLVEVIMGVGNWSDQDGEYYRHPFGNALAEKAYADYEYKKILSAGEQTIDGKKYRLSKDFYATVKKGTDPKVAITDNQLHLENGLETLSPKVSDRMAVEPIRETVVKTAKEVVTKPADTKSWKRLLVEHKLLVLLPVILLLIIFAIECRGRKRRKAQVNNERLSRRNR